jgi:predicted dehydrogenase
LRYFDSSFSMQVKDDNIRVDRDKGGGPLYDIGIYCINAARSLVRDEPREVVCRCVQGDDPRFSEIEEMASATLHFPGNRVASFTASFGAADVSSYRIVGTEADLRVEPAYDYTEKLAHHLTRDGRTTRKSFSKRDQFAPELIHFSECVLEHRDPEPCGQEGMADVTIIQALYRSAREGRSVSLDLPRRQDRPDLEQEISKPPVPKPELVHAESASR